MTDEEVFKIYNSGCGGIGCTEDRLAAHGITQERLNEAFKNLRPDITNPMTARWEMK